VILHGILVALTVFYLWETVKAIVGLPHYVHTAIVTAGCWAAWALPEHWLWVGATASLVGILHGFLGAGGEPTFTLRIPQWSKRSKSENRTQRLYVPTL
jgi:hypothetical protein